MTLVLVALAVLLAGGVAALFAGASDERANVVGGGAALAGSLLAGAGAVVTLFGAPEPPVALAWAIPLGSLAVALDALSALFVLPAALLGATCALFGMGYLPRHAHGRRLGPPWFFFDLLLLGMLLTLLARNGVLFLFGWEVMSLAAYFLVTFEDDDGAVRRAGFVYLVATQVGTACLLAFFALLGGQAGSLDFAAIDAWTPTAAVAGTAFVLALGGFGAKAGLVPFHVWLPEAHPAAPSHVSAIMSGAMIKIGLYGLLRALLLLGPARPWWAWTLVGLGVASALLGVLSALVQRDLKRVLAFSTVENAGLVAAGIGFGLLGTIHGLPLLTALGYGGALLHVLNHALFKGALFLAAGAIKDRLHTLSLDALGGLWKRLPVTGKVFLSGALSGAALPPTAGFAGELLVLGAALTALGARTWGSSAAARSLPGIPLALAVAALALVGGGAIAAYARAFGFAFLGEPRTARAADGDVRGAMRAALALSGALVVAGSILLPLLLFAVAPAAAVLGLPADIADPAGLAPVFRLLVAVTATGLALCLLVLVLALLRGALLREHGQAETGTWDCGYVQPTARMQYTASSFGLPLGGLFRGLLGLVVEATPPAGPFPRDARAAVAADDVLLVRGYGRLAELTARALAPLRWIQHGRVQSYVLYVALTLLVLLVWKFGR